MTEVNGQDFSLEAIRRDFPNLERQVHGKPLVYFDNGATSFKPRQVIDTVQSYYQNDVSNVHRGVHYLSEEGTNRFEQARRTLRDFINAEKEEEIIFTKGTSEAVNLVASSFAERLKPGDHILVSTLEHHSNIVPWQIYAERKGARVLEAKITGEGEIDLNALRAQLENGAKLLAITHCSNTLGTITPIKDIIQMAHEFGCLVFVDAAQSVPHTLVDVREIDADFLCFSGHKMYGPNGVGVLYGKERLLEELPPYQGGGAMIDRVSFSGTTFHTLPHKFEAGTPNVPGVLGLEQAALYLKNLGIKNVEAHEQDLLGYLESGLRTLGWPKILGPSSHKAAIVSFVAKDAHPHDIGTLLDQQGVAIRTGHHCTQPLMDFYETPGTCRASLAVYNSRLEIDRFLEAMKKVESMLF